MHMCCSLQHRDVLQHCRAGGLLMTTVVTVGYQSLQQSECPSARFMLQHLERDSLHLHSGAFPWLCNGNDRFGAKVPRSTLRARKFCLIENTVRTDFECDAAVVCVCVVPRWVGGLSEAATRKACLGPYQTHSSISHVYPSIPDSLA